MSMLMPKYHVDILLDNCRFNNIRYTYLGYEYNMRVLSIPGVRAGPKAAPHNETAVSAQVKESSEETQVRKIRDIIHTITELLDLILILLCTLWHGVKYLKKACRPSWYQRQRRHDET